MKLNHSHANTALTLLRRAFRCEHGRAVQQPFEQIFAPAHLLQYCSAPGKCSRAGKLRKRLGSIFLWLCYRWRNVFWIRSDREALPYVGKEQHFGIALWYEIGLGGLAMGSRLWVETGHCSLLASCYKSESCKWTFYYGFRWARTPRRRFLTNLFSLHAGTTLCYGPYITEVRTAP